MTRHTSIVTFMELNLIMWTSYLVLLFCYDENFIGEHSPVTAVVAFGCLVGAFFDCFRRLLKIQSWGYAIRFSIATVVVFWTFVEVLWTLESFCMKYGSEPMAYKTEMITILLAFFALLAFLFYQSAKKKNRSVS